MAIPNMTIPNDKIAYFTDLVGKNVVFNGENGSIIRPDFSRIKLGQLILVIMLSDTGVREGIVVNDYDFNVKNDIVEITSKKQKPILAPAPAPTSTLAPVPKPASTSTPVPAPTQASISNAAIAPPVPSQDYRIYHSTSIDNMINIIKSGGLWSRGKLKQTEASFHDTASNSIISKRVKLGIVHTIPFHFKPKTPYEYAVFTNKAHNGHKTVPKDDMVVIDINRHKYDNCSFIFTAHPLSKIAVKYDANSNDIPNLGFWKVLDEYKDFTPGGWKNKQICMAEYDVNLDFIPLDDILEVYVQTQGKVDLLLKECVKNNKDGILKDKISIGDVHFLVK